jgi:hypothetical protein
MYLLDLDESGNENDPSDRFFVLGGIALFERQTYFVSAGVDQVQERHFPGLQPITFHASEIRSGREFWRPISPGTRDAALADLCQVFQRTPARGRCRYAAAIEKSADLWGEAAVAKATEKVCRRFDSYLQRQFHENQYPQRGLLVFSEGRFDARAKIWVKGFHERGTTWGAINNLADIPHLAAMKESRLVQLADLVAHSVWLLYEKRDSKLFERIESCFDNKDGVLHGLVHIRPEGSGRCDCPACASRREHGNRGAWLSDSG